MKATNPDVSNIPAPSIPESPSDCAMEMDGFKHVAQKRAKRKRDMPQESEENIQSPLQMNNQTNITWNPKCESVDYIMTRHGSANLEPPHHNHPWWFGSVSLELFDDLKKSHPNAIKRQDKIPSLAVPRARERSLSEPTAGIRRLLDPTDSKQESGL